MQEEYMTYDEAADYIGIKRFSLPYQLKQLNIKTHKFKLDKRRYIKRSDVERMRQVREGTLKIEDEEEEARAFVSVA